MSKLASAAEQGKHAIGKKARKSARRTAGKMVGRMLLLGARATGRAAWHAIARAGASGSEALLTRMRRLPIQRSVDVAAPLEVTWEQWMEFDHLPEGARRATDVEREGDYLSGCLDGAGSRDWEAEVIDERENESFAWRSLEGSDSAGLVTFHQLSDRLTRVELNLDVRPVDLFDAASLATHLADVRAQAELRRFKAQVELLNPDVYDELLSENGSNGSGQGDDSADDDDYAEDDDYSEEDD